MNIFDCSGFYISKNDLKRSSDIQCNTVLLFFARKKHDQLTDLEMHTVIVIIKIKNTLLVSYVVYKPCRMKYHLIIIL